jgi:hypothetical protein
MHHEQMLTICREIEAISIEMEDGVQGGDWDAIIALDTKLSMRIDALQAAGGFNGNISPSDRFDGAVLITKILKSQANVREAIKAKVSDLTSVLTTNSVAQKLSHAYGALPRK